MVRSYFSRDNRLMTGGTWFGMAIMHALDGRFLFAAILFGMAMVILPYSPNTNRA